MPDPKAQPPAKEKTKKRGWLRRLLRWVGIFILLVIVFHRPLFHNGVRLIAIQVAARYHLNVDLHLSGSIFTDLTVSRIRVYPTGATPSPVRKIEIGHLRLDYSIPSLIKHGIGEFLSSYEIVDSQLELDALPSKSEPEHEEKQEIGQTLNNILGQPAFYADRVRIQNFNITIRSQTTVTDVKNFNLILDPEQPGQLHVDRLEIPGVPVWSNLQAETSYVGRNFFIRRLELTPDLVIKELNFDASQRAQNKASIQLQAQVFGGSLGLSLAGTQLNKKGENLQKSYDTVFKLDVSDVALEPAAAYFGAPKPPVAKLANLSLQFSGEPERPRTWRGNVAAKVDGITAGATKIDSAGLSVTVNDGHGSLKAGNITFGKNAVNFTAELALPASVNEFPSSDVDATLDIAAPDIPELTAMLPQPVKGSLTGGGPIHLHGGKVNADLAIDAREIATGNVTVAEAKLHLTADKRVVPAPPNPLDDLTAHVSAEVGNIQVQSFSVDSVKLDVGVQNSQVALTMLEVSRAGNSINAHGTYRVPPDMKDAAKSPVDAEFAIHIPKLDAFGIAANGHPVSGHIEGQGNVKMAGSAMSGKISITGGDFRLGDFQTGPLSIKVNVADNAATIEEFTLKLRGNDQIAITGKGGIQPPFSYDAGLVLDIASLGSLKPLLNAFNVKQEVAGSLHLAWRGNGASVETPATLDPPTPVQQTLENTGDLSLSLAKGHVDKIDLSEIKINGSYGADFANIKELRLVSGPTAFSSEVNLSLKDSLVKIANIHLQQAGTPVLTGEISVPVDIKNSVQPVPFDKPLSVKITADKLDIEKLAKTAGKAPPVNGNISVSLNASGTVLDPIAQLKITGRMLQAKEVKQLAPAELDVDVNYARKEVNLQADVKQALIRPLSIRGKVPLDMEAIVKNKAMDPHLPVDATVQLPPTSLAIVPKFVPAVRRLDGTAGVDVHVTGTVDKPSLSGSATIDLKEARMANEDIPVLDTFHARLAFANDTLNFSTFEGGLGGGKFKLGGSVKLTKLTEPVFDLRLQSKEVLAMRNDSITVRANTDVKVAGPLNAANVSGLVEVTHSRFFKEIDILPISLPGKAKPAPKSVQSKEISVSFPQPPLRDWKFDLAIKTPPKDPFIIRGNLANGKAEIDLHLKGTGLNPTMEGNVHIAQFDATLPFSTLSVSRGFVYFTADAPFQPSLDLQADSQIRDYLIHAYVYGKATDPQVTLTAEPPLQYSDIVALLATGSTASELGSNADVLASRAAMLAIQELYHKIFHHGQAAPEEKKGDSLVDRFQFELGALDNKTGQQEVSSKLKLTDRLYLLGDLGLGGRFTGGLKYLIRFR